MTKSKTFTKKNRSKRQRRSVKRSKRTVKRSKRTVKRRTTNNGITTPIFDKPKPTISDSIFNHNNHSSGNIVIGLRDHLRR